MRLDAGLSIGSCGGSLCDVGMFVCDACLSHGRCCATFRGAGLSLRSSFNLCMLGVEGLLVGVGVGSVRLTGSLRHDNEGGDVALGMGMRRGVLAWDFVFSYVCAVIVKWGPRGVVFSWASWSMSMPVALTGTCVGSGAGRLILWPRSVVPQEVGPGCDCMWLEGLEGFGWFPSASYADSRAYS